MNSEVLPGESSPLGATVHPLGVNFSVFSKNCTALELLLFDSPDDRYPPRTIRLDPEKNRTFYYWHAFVPDLRPGQLYGYRVYGPFAPEQGHRFDGNKVLLDPYVRAVAVPASYRRAAAMQPGDNCAQAMKGVVVDTRVYDWEGDVHPGLPFSNTVIYEVHVGGFTRNPNSGLAPDKRGTYAGLIEKIPYLTSLGITAVELLPVQQFDDQDAPVSLKNYWGYSPIALFAAHAGYSSRPDPLGPVDEFRDMVKALHRAGIEVILDVVFNHTAEGDHHGPTLSFRGLENRAYYIPDANPALYANFSGCGNTLNANHSIVRRMIMDCLHYWVEEMHVDGFRFDLASVLARDESGQPIKNPPILWEIESDPVLADVKIIAEAWDSNGLYQVGSFIGHRWAEWNDRFRDDIRRCVKSDNDTIATLTLRMVGSPDLYPQPGREPNRSINFVTCHDGFTLNDLVSYNSKHNEANGEGNRDGNDSNNSWNCGIEGPTDAPAVEALRTRQIKNFFTLLLIAQGTPMLLMGDEVRRTQYGNNNAYCQDNPTAWFDWDGVTRHQGLPRFVQGLIRFTQTRAIFREERFWTSPEKQKEPIIVWHGVRLDQLDWRPSSHSAAFSLHHRASGDRMHVMINSYWEPLTFELPTLPGKGHWTRILDTALVSPQDFCEQESSPPIVGRAYHLDSRSIALLLAQ